NSARRNQHRQYVLLEVNRVRVAGFSVNDFAVTSGIGQGNFVFARMHQKHTSWQHKGNASSHLNKCNFYRVNPL
ncbi:MAG: hypothetical protein ACPHM0_04695, partial [Flavobacteriales bacterium]